MTLVNLHNHTSYSSLDSICKIKDLVARAKELDQPALAVTDHGTLSGVIDFYKECLKQKIKPIIGSELYICPDHLVKEKGIRPNHIVLLAKNTIGYKNLIKLSSVAYTEGIYYKPRIDLKLLRQYSDGLICMTACLRGEVPSALLAGQYDKAETLAKAYLDIFHDDLYIELHNHGLKEEDVVRPQLISLARKLGIQTVCAGDTHYLKKEDYLAHDVLLCIQTKAKLTDTDRFKYETDQLYLKSEKEMRELFDEEAINNTVAIANKCSLEIPLGVMLIPNFPLPEGFENTHKYLGSLVNAGAKKRFGKLNQEQKDRLLFEMKTIQDMGYSNYFLIIQDIMREARDRGIYTGVARGSVGGCLTAYVLGITKVNPLIYGLIFERFLNPDRISIPDIDSDIEDTRRDEIIQYIKDKYGEDRVNQIVTFGTLGTKAVIKDVARVLGINYDVANKATALLPAASTLEEAEKNTDFMDLMKAHPQWFPISKTLEGLHRHTGIHAAGLVITPLPITEYAPLYSNGETTAIAIDMYSLDDLGVMKIDILGLKTLGIIKNTITLIGKNIDMDAIPLDDPKVYELFSKADTDCIFQFESSGMRQYLKKLKPTNIEDLSIMNSLYRPGPLDAGMVDVYMKRRTGKEKIEYLHPLLEPILKDTCSVIIYQEQCVFIARALAGFTLAQGDTLRKAIGKKDAALMDKQKELFINGCIKNKVDKSIAETVFELIKTFGRYGFCHGHSVGYSILSYQTAWLKTYYPVEFMAANLTTETGDKERVGRLLQTCRRMGIKIYPPDINRSENYFKVVDGGILFSLNAIVNIGEDLLKDIQALRPFTSILDFVTRVDSKSYNVRKLEALIKSGSFDSFGSRQAHMAQLPYVNKLGRLSSGPMLFQPECAIELSKEEYGVLEILKGERESTGFYISNHPLDICRESHLEVETIRDIGTPTGRVLGMVTAIKKHKDRSGADMAFVTMEDLSGPYDVILFKAAYKEDINKFKVGNVLLVSGRIDLKGEPKIVANQSIVIMEL